MKRPAETITFTIGGIMALLMALGFDRPVAAGVAVGVAALPGIITAIVEAIRSNR